MKSFIISILVIAVTIVVLILCLKSFGKQGEEILKNAKKAMKNKVQLGGDEEVETAEPPVTPKVPILPKQAPSNASAGGTKVFEMPRTDHSGNANALLLEEDDETACLPEMLGISYGVIDSRENHPDIQYLFHSTVDNVYDVSCDSDEDFDPTEMDGNVVIVERESKTQTQSGAVTQELYGNEYHIVIPKKLFKDGKVFISHRHLAIGRDGETYFLRIRKGNRHPTYLLEGFETKGSERKPFGKVIEPEQDFDLDREKLLTGGIVLFVASQFIKIELQSDYFVTTEQEEFVASASCEDSALEEDEEDYEPEPTKQIKRFSRNNG